MLSPFKKTQISVYRKTPPVGNWGDPTWNKVGTIAASIYPLSAEEAMKAGQFTKPVKEVIIVYDLTANIKEDDEVTYDTTHRSIAGIRPHRSGFLNHLAVYTTDSQWVR